MNPIQIEENKSSMPSNHSQVLAILEELSSEFKVEEKPSSIANQTIPVYEEERKYPGIELIPISELVLEDVKFERL